jgi:predicted small lipoprotein YifL
MDDASLPSADSPIAPADLRGWERPVSAQHPRWLVLGLVLACLLGSCGRKGDLEPPPDAERPDAAPEAPG